MEVGAAASVITLVQTAWYLSVKVKKLIVNIKRLNEDVQQLEDKADNLGAIIREVENACEIQEEHSSTLPREPGRDNIRTLVNDAIGRCKEDLREFEEELSKLLENRNNIAGNVLRKWRQQTAAPTFARIAKSIESHQLSLQLLIQILHGRSLDSTRQVMAQGFVAVLASNRKMFAMLQGLADPQQGLTRRDTEATLVPQPDNEAEGQTVLPDENDQALHQFFERIFAVWLKNNVADSNSPVLAKQTTSPGSSPNPSNSTISASNWKVAPLGSYTMGHGRLRRPSSPGMDPMEIDSANPLRIIPSSSSSTHSYTSSVSATSSNSMMTRSTSVFGSSQTPDRPRFDRRTSRSSETRRSNERSIPLADTRIQSNQGQFNSQSREKGKALLECVRQNDIQTMQRLIEDGATLEEGDGTDRTPILVAVSEGNVDAFNILRQSGANLRARDSTDQTALHLAIRRPSVHIVVPLLLEPPESQQHDSSSLLQNHFVNARDKIGRAPLHECARFGMLELAETLIARGADINSRDSKGHPPAWHAMKNRHYELVELLVEKKADFGDFEWPPPHDISREINILLEEKGWKRPCGITREDSRGEGKSNRPENRRPSRSWRKPSLKS